MLCFLRPLFWIAAIIAAFWAFVLELIIISKAAGLLGLVLALTLFPITFTLAPFWAGFAWGDWQPLLVSAVSMLLFWAGALCRRAPSPIV